MNCVYTMEIGAQIGKVSERQGLYGQTYRYTGTETERESIVTEPLDTGEETRRRMAQMVQERDRQRDMRIRGGNMIPCTLENLDGGH